MVPNVLCVHFPEKILTAIHFRSPTVFPYKIAQIETIKTVYWLPPQKTEKYKYRKTVALKNNEQAKKPFPLIYQSLDK